ncbi:transaldolase [Mycobacterium tuberculosis GM 1503]|nr:transaldolase [Mycobacterium tuberculosis GM 1503]
MTAQNPNLAALSAAGVSVWLDDLSRDRLRSGNLQELIDTKSVVGVTTNPSIFQKALSEGHTYDAQIAELAARGADVDATIRTVTTDDVRSACDVLVPQWEDSDGVDGRVSIEVDPRLAHETEKTIQQAIELWKIVDRPNLFIKIPATKAGLPAISAVLAEGISVNVTLILLRAAVPRGDGRLPDRDGKGPASRTQPVQDPFGGIVFRLPGGHRNRQAAGQNRLAASARTARPGRCRQCPPGLCHLPGGLRRQRSLSVPQGRRRPGPAPVVGFHRREEPRLLGHPLRHRVGRPTHREHYAGKDN